ncbi:MAG: CoA pyrophosphatase [Pseudomonadota bacterium]
MPKPRALRIKHGAEPSSDFDFDLSVRPNGRALRDAAVLVPLQFYDGAWSVVLTKRSSKLSHHPGQIAFPGGKVDRRDGSTLNAALREAEEEIGLPKSGPLVLGTLPSHETVSGFLVHPYVAAIPEEFDPKPEIGEVEEIFRVPLSHLMNPENYLREGRLWKGDRRYYFTVPYGPYYIWGATARILKTLSQSLEGPYAD